MNQSEASLAVFWCVQQARSAAHPGGKAELSTATVSVGSGNVHLMRHAFHAAYQLALRSEGVADPDSVASWRLPAETLQLLFRGLVGKVKAAVLQGCLDQ